jgi:hypothetical protein
VRGDYGRLRVGRAGPPRQRLASTTASGAKIQQQFHAHVNLWRRPLQTCIPTPGRPAAAASRRATSPTRAGAFTDLGRAPREPGPRSLRPRVRADGGPPQRIQLTNSPTPRSSSWLGAGPSGPDGRRALAVPRSFDERRTPPAMPRTRSA